MIVLGECSDTPEVENMKLFGSEKKNVLLEWTKLIKKRSILLSGLYIWF